jgi:hypothetical protein
MSFTDVVHSLSMDGVHHEKDTHESVLQARRRAKRRRYRRNKKAQRTRPGAVAKQTWFDEMTKAREEARQWVARQKTYVTPPYTNPIPWSEYERTGWTRSKEQEEFHSLFLKECMPSFKVHVGFSGIRRWGKSCTSKPRPMRDFNQWLLEPEQRGLSRESIVAAFRKWYKPGMTMMR